MEAYTKKEFESKLQEMGKKYHIFHPYNEMLHDGHATKDQIQAWVANRFYYQVSIPIKDALVLANCPDVEVRRKWTQRIIDHDSVNGGIDCWVILGESCGIKRDEMFSFNRLLPGVKFAVDAYVNYVRHSTWQEAACSSLTELFAPQIHRKRLETWPKHYQWIEQRGLAYFQKRLSEARRDVEFGLESTLDYFNTFALQKKALDILQFKLDVLWCMSDAMYLAYVLNKPPYYCCKS